MSKLLWWAALNVGKPDPPAVAKAKHVVGEVRAAAQLTNLVLPEVRPKEGDPSC